MSRYQITEKMLEYIREFHGAYGPVPMKVLSGQFGKMLKPEGGFRIVVEELRKDGSIQVLISYRGKRLVLPGEAEVTSVPEGYALLKHG